MNKQIVSILMAATISTIAWSLSIPIEAQEDVPKITSMREEEKAYKHYLEQYKHLEKPQVEIIVQGEDYFEKDLGAQVSKATYKGEEALIWEKYGGKVSWRVNVGQTGLYNINVRHASILNIGRNTEFKIKVNHELPFESAENLRLTKLWQDETGIIKDQYGNDLKPKQIPSLEWIDSVLQDSEGVYDTPYYFYLEEGENIITFEMQDANVAIDFIKIYNDAPIAGYKTWYEQTNPVASKGEYLNIIEAESNMVYKSDSTLSPAYDRSSPVTSPQHPVNLKYNIIGGDSWKYQGQWISWKFDVPESGYYEIGMRARQNIRNGMTSYRRIYIDNRIPYEELMDVAFPFNYDWYMKRLGEEIPYLFYLEEGEHEIKLEVVPGEMSRIYAELQQCIYQLNELYRKVFMVTGPSPDGFRDYMLEQQIPNLLEKLRSMQEDLVTMRDSLIEITGEKGSEIGNFDKLIVQIASFIKEPDNIAQAINEFNNNIGSLAAWMSQLKEQPLEIDYFYVKSQDAALPKVKGNFFENLWFDMQCIWASFTQDYSESTSYIAAGEEPLEIWIGVGRDQLNIVQELVDDYFTPETGIKVDISLVQRSILEPVLAGKGPDATLLTPSSEIMNLAFRNAIMDFKDFEDFEEVVGWFQEEAFVPYEFEEGIYGLPLVQAFPMLFYRKDILEEMNMDIPTTWEELYEANDILQRKYMQIGVPSTLDTFAMMLYQKGGGLYVSDFKQTAFHEELGIESFIEWTDLYTKRGYPLTYDFYNRFRRGELPLGIAPYTMYTMLEVAAPEIKGLWGMTEVVGTPDEKGEINRTTTSTTKQGAMILKDSDKQEEAWEFIKWFASPEIQAEFGVEVENLMGPLGRYAPANREAFKQLPWSQKEQELIISQWDELQEIPEIPGNYYVTRQLDYAFKSVVNTFANPRHELNKYNQIINEEITRKRAELRLGEK